MEGLIIFIKFDLQKDKVTQLRTSYTVLVAVRARTPAIGLSFQHLIKITDGGRYRGDRVERHQAIH